MSIPNELSSDIAVALLARGGTDPEQLREMKELIFRIHATLQEKDRIAETQRRAPVAGFGIRNDQPKKVEEE